AGRPRQARGAAPPGWLDGGRGQASEVAGDPAGEVGDPPRATAAPPARPGAPRAPSATPPPCSGRSQCRGRSAGHDDGAQAGEPRVAHPSRLVRAARGRAARERLGPQGRCLAPRAASRGRAGGPLRVGGGPAPPGRAAHQGAVQRPPVGSGPHLGSLPRRVARRPPAAAPAPARRQGPLAAAGADQSTARRAAARLRGGPPRPGARRRPRRACAGRNAGGRWGRRGAAAAAAAGRARRCRPRSARRRHWWIARRPRRTECLSERSARWRRWWIARRPLRSTAWSCRARTHLARCWPPPRSEKRSACGSPSGHRSGRTQGGRPGSPDRWPFQSARVLRFRRPGPVTGPRAVPMRRRPHRGRHRG
ncbi:unnamed protein product, partial [Prorocentrum cordatum]